MTDGTVEEAIQQLREMGLLDDWWCVRCKDHVPYRVLEMTEAESRRLHYNHRHHAAPGGGPREP